MSFQITTAFVKQFSNTVELLAQQRGSKLRGAVRVEPVRGEVAFFDQIGATSAVTVTTRHADSPLVSTPHSRRRVSLVDVEWGDLIENFDKVKMLIDPTNAYSQNAAYAIGRKIDEIIIDAFFGTAYSGKDGGTSVAFPSTNQIAADFDGDGTKEGLTIAKLREARKRLLAKNVDPAMSPWYIAVTAAQLDDLLGTTEVTSSDFNTVKALVQGEINTFLGFRFIQTELLSTDSAGDRRCPVWAQNGMVLGMAMEPRSRITERPDKRYQTYVYWATSAGATRLDEDRVFEIKCKE